METGIKQQFRKFFYNNPNQFVAGKQREEPKMRLPEQPPVQEQPDKNPIPIRTEPGIDEPEKDDPTHIDEEIPIFNNY